MNIAFLWWWDRAQEIMPNWRDGLRAALEEIGKTQRIEFCLGEFTPKDEFDFYLLWGDSNCPGIDAIQNFRGRKGIILTTGPVNWLQLSKLDVIFCESTPVYEAVRSRGLRAMKAFGTDDVFYTPKPNDYPKDIPYFYPATFSPWKKQSDIAYLEDRLLCIGTVQPDGQAELESCRSHGVHILEGYFQPETILNSYQRARFVPIPAIHGSERTCLEAMSMNIVPSVNPKNRKTLSYVEEYIHSDFHSPREFILNTYSAKIYAENLMKGISP